MGLFSKCTQCGRRVFAPRCDPSGLCDECIAQNREKERQLKESALAVAKAAEKTAKKAAEIAAEKAAAEECYQQIVDAYKFLTMSDRNRTNDPILAESTFERLTQLLDKVEHLPHFVEVFSRHCQIYNTTCVTDDFGFLTAEKVTEDTRSVKLIQILEPAKKALEKTRRIHAATQVFEQRLTAIPHVDIEIDPNAAPCSHPILPIITKNITASTPISRLNPFFAIDVETTGLNPQEDEIIQLAAVKFINFEPVEAYATYVCPRHGLNPKAQAVNGITAEQVADAPYIEQVAKSFAHFIGVDAPKSRRSALVGHNISFDCGFLSAAGILPSDASLPCYDTLNLSKREFPSIGRYNLNSMGRIALEIARNTSHNALSDAFLAGSLFRELCKRRIGADAL